ncbi:hypothetical protein [Bradyrhizobium sp. 151]|uniref:hypothetical protein n=1 Tax=Bradyrhizobium sp. 151 TaxID=2782626 RepID=UPI001FF70A01|nr:hypothetical protein [Bradyrhizobium sp. 151]MCK1657127.1 hypothetical protein [Bradyrhizobium sp. 151]
MDRAALSRIAEACRHGVDLEVEDRVDLAIALEAWLSGAAGDLDQAFGVSRRRGQRGNRTIAAARSRDDLLRACAEQYYTGLSRRQQAAAIAQAGTRYAASAWRIDQLNPAMPARYAGTPTEAFWQVLSAGSIVPGQRRLIAILGECAASSGDFIAQNAV